ncbi:MAG TPA: hypothetical protein VG206_09280 [Terriglobia bacterium]|nr:hypothetical protein [Terriglobia bacterium]
MAPFFWTHYYWFLEVITALVLVIAIVLHIRGLIWKERGDFMAFLLELVVIVMIAVELKEGHDQGAVLDALNESAKATADTLKGLQSTQGDSAKTLGQMNDSIQLQARTTESMQRVLQQQLAILSGEQKARLEQAQLRPQLLVMLFRNVANSELVRLIPNSTVPVPYARTPYSPTHDAASPAVRNSLDFYIRNIGNTPLGRPKFTARIGRPNKYVCMEFPFFNIGATSYTLHTLECDPGTALVEVLPDLPPSPDQALRVEGNEMYCRVLYDDPDKIPPYFEMDLTVSADNFPTTRYEVQVQYVGLYP